MGQIKRRRKEERNKRKERWTVSLARPRHSQPNCPLQPTNRKKKKEEKRTARVGLSYLAQPTCSSPFPSPSLYLLLACMGLISAYWLPLSFLSLVCGIIEDQRPKNGPAYFPLFSLFLGPTRPSPFRPTNRSGQMGKAQPMQPSFPHQ